MVEPHSSNFRVITTNFFGVRIFRKFTVLLSTNYHISRKYIIAANTNLRKLPSSGIPRFPSCMATALLGCFRKFLTPEVDIAARESSPNIQPLYVSLTGCAFETYPKKGRSSKAYITRLRPSHICDGRSSEARNLLQLG